jgi:hypothetical protein
LRVIIRNLPFFDRTTTAQVRGRSISINRDLIVVWVSLSEIGLRACDPRTPRFPAVLDTGCNHSFVIREQHLVEWAGIASGYFPTLGGTRIYGSTVPQLAANVWLHRNRSGCRDEFTEQSPHLLESDVGIAVVPSTVGGDSPRLPLLGLRALRWNHLSMSVDGRRCRVNVRMHRRFLVFT